MNSCFPSHIFDRHNNVMSYVTSHLRLCIVDSKPQSSPDASFRSEVVQNLLPLQTLHSVYWEQHDFIPWGVIAVMIMLLALGGFVTPRCAHFFAASATRLESWTSYHCLRHKKQCPFLGVPLFLDSGRVRDACTERRRCHGFGQLWRTATVTVAPRA